MIQILVVQLNFATLDESDFVILDTKEVREYYMKKRDSISRDTEEKQKHLGVTYDHVFSYFLEP